MTENQISLVQESYKKVDAISEAAASIFYTRLFELQPEFRETLFKDTDIKEQGKKLMLMIKTAVNGLKNIDKLVPTVQQLGQRHAGYGVKDDHYDIVGSALIYTLEKGLGNDFDTEVKNAWIACYTLLAGTMKDAAKA